MDWHLGVEIKKWKFGHGDGLRWIYCQTVIETFQAIINFPTVLSTPTGILISIGFGWTVMLIIVIKVFL